MARGLTVNQVYTLTGYSGSSPLIGASLNKVEVKMKKLLILSLMCITFASNVFAKDVKCKIVLDGVLTDKTCEFTQSKGSFQLGSSYQDVVFYKVLLTGKDTGKVYIKDLNGDLHDNGKVIRSKTDSSCWIGVERDIKLCAYLK